MSLFESRFQRVLDSSGPNVLIVGVGGGFDFVHSMLLIADLKRLKKNVTIASYSFGDPRNYSGDVYWTNGKLATESSASSTTEAPRSFEQPMCVKRIDATHTSVSADYAPELHVCSFLDQEWPDAAPHGMYALYARSWTINGLFAFYQHLVSKHAINLIIGFDGGTDSLVVGDESGLGDPVEDAVTVAVMSRLPIKKLLLTVGFGCDRFNHVSDASSLRAVAELTALGGFLGAVTIDKDGEPFSVYRRALDHIYSKQTFRSVLAGATCTAVAGDAYGFAVPAEISRRVFQSQSSGLYIWPLMAMIWAFDPDVVARRSKIIGWIDGAATAAEQAHLFNRQRGAVAVRPIENFPQQERFDR